MMNKKNKFKILTVTFAFLFLSCFILLIAIITKKDIDDKKYYDQQAIIIENESKIKYLEFQAKEYSDSLRTYKGLIRDFIQYGYNFNKYEYGD